MAFDVWSNRDEGVLGVRDFCGDGFEKLIVFREFPSLRHGVCFVRFRALESSYSYVVTIAGAHTAVKVKN